MVRTLAETALAPATALTNGCNGFAANRALRARAATLLKQNDHDDNDVGDCGVDDYKLAKRAAVSGYRLQISCCCWLSSQQSKAVTVAPQNASRRRHGPGRLTRGQVGRFCCHTVASIMRCCPAATVYWGPLGVEGTSET